MFSSKAHGSVFHSMFDVECSMCNTGVVIIKQCDLDRVEQTGMTHGHSDRSSKINTQSLFVAGSPEPIKYDGLRAAQDTLGDKVEKQFIRFFINYCG